MDLSNCLDTVGLKNSSKKVRRKINELDIKGGYAEDEGKEQKIEPQKDQDSEIEENVAQPNKEEKRPEESSTLPKSGDKKGIEGKPVSAEESLKQKQEEEKLKENSKTVLDKFKKAMQKDNIQHAKGFGEKSKILISAVNGPEKETKKEDIYEDRETAQKKIKEYYTKKSICFLILLAQTPDQKDRKEEKKKKPKDADSSLVYQEDSDQKAPRTEFKEVKPEENSAIPYLSSIYKPKP